jgi:Domain of unknown function (DUF1707)
MFGRTPVRAKDEITAATGSHGRIRASDDDRERVLDMVKAAFVQGRLNKDELDARLGQTLGSRTWAELTSVTADLPSWPIARPPAKPVRSPSRRPMSMIVRPVAGALSAAAVLTLVGIGGMAVRGSPEEQACRLFYGWQSQAVVGMPALNAAVITATQGSDRHLTVDLEKLLQAVRHYENAGGPGSSGTTQELAQEQVAADSTQVGADCAPY